MQGKLMLEDILHLSLKLSSLLEDVRLEWNKAWGELEGVEDFFCRW